MGSVIVIPLPDVGVNVQHLAKCDATGTPFIDKMRIEAVRRILKAYRRYKLKLTHKLKGDYDTSDCRNRNRANACVITRT